MSEKMHSVAEMNVAAQKSYSMSRAAFRKMTNEEFEKEIVEFGWSGDSSVAEAKARGFDWGELQRKRRIFLGYPQEPEPDRER